MDVFIDVVSKVIAFGALVGGAWWGVVKFLKRDELFPRIYFEVSAKFVGQQDDRILVEILALIENKGEVPISINDLKFKVRALYKDDAVKEGDNSIRGQIRIPHLLLSGSWIPEDWDSTFIYPGVKTEYNYIAAIPLDVSFIRVAGSFTYEREGSSHHAAKLQKVPASIP